MGSVSKLLRWFFISAALAASLSASFANEETHTSYDWNGVYLGGQVGVGNGAATLTGIGNPVISGLPATTTPNGAIVGVTGGYNWQYGDWVFGFEASFSAGKLDASFAPLSPPWFVNTQISDVITAGPRVGFAHDRILFFGEAGFASARVDMEAPNIGPNWNPPAKRSHGIYIGGGVDWALEDDWIVGAEFNRIFLQDQQFSDTTNTGTLVTNAGDIGVNMVSLKVTKKLN